MISCSNLYQDLTSTTVELTPEFISHVRNTTTGDNNYIFAKLTCGRKTITKKIDISEQTAANGAVLTFDNLIVGKKGSVYIAVANDKTVEDFKSEIIASIEGTTNFTVQPNNQTKIKVSLKENEEKFFAQFLTFLDNEESPISNIELNFTEYSTITAPLPVGTTRWSIRETSTENYQGQLIGSFGEKIDVKNELMKYREKFFEISDNNKNLIQVYFEATGNPMNQIKTPVVYCEALPDAEADDYYRYKILGSETSISTRSEKLTDYCFDNAGNLYYISSESASKLHYDFDTNSYKSYSISPFYGGSPAQSIAYDKAQNALYLLRLFQGETFSLAKFSNPAGTIYGGKGYYVEYKSFPWPTEVVETSQSWTAHNGKIYVASVQQTEDDNGNSYNLVLQEYVEETYTCKSEGEEKKYTINVNNTNLNFTTDIMYQDGSLYVIFSCFNNNWAGNEGENIYYNYSTGGIVKYNIESGKFDKSFGIKGFAPNNSKKINGTKEHNISFCAPTKGTESTSFYGPTKFVAIMPKKLVFLDQGASIDDYAYNPNTPNNNNNIPTKSRIVEYDLSTNSFSSTEITGTDLYISFAFTM